LWRQFDHPNVVPFLGVDRQTFEARYAIVTPWMENGNMLEYIRRQELPFYRILLLITKLEEAARGLHYLHEHEFVHGDLRAANVLIDDCGHACLTDFGLTFVDHIASSNGSSTTAHGNARWLPLEMLNGSQDRPQCSTDVFSFGRVMLEASPEYMYRRNLIWNEVERPTVDGVPSQAVPDWLWNLMLWCWEPDPMARPMAYDVLIRL
ncbi:kinase-like protein, partial [Punctularia strigosozonata HHB-11173 SS5]|uniref:kinase-like protein n=1 Tax=Punctularia strigosozonata (strain HHB-11173) TaxID=741275 RepID=UPI0004418309